MIIIIHQILKETPMVTDRTPPHKRIARAELGRNQWKNKAQLRREENEKLKRDLESKDNRISELKAEIKTSKNEQILLQKKMKEQEKLIESLKKKHSK
jgi:hypothetical protein